MDGLTGIGLANMDIFLLVLVRMTGLFVIAPVFGRRSIPAYFKVGFAFFSAIIVVNTFSFNTVFYTGFPDYAMIVLVEFVVGISLGFISYMVLNAIYVAGQIIDMQIGFGMVNVINPMNDIQVPITANFYYIVSILIFLIIGGHHMVIKALYDSYRFVPIGGAVFGRGIMDEVVSLFGNLFVTGFRIAAPVTAAILVANVALGVMSRAVPQLNVFVLGMPLKIMLGIAVILVSMPLFVSILENIYGEMNGEMFRFMEELGP